MWFDIELILERPDVEVYQPPVMYYMVCVVVAGILFVLSNLLFLYLVRKVKYIKIILICVNFINFVIILVNFTYIILKIEKSSIYEVSDIHICI